MRQGAADKVVELAVLILLAIGSVLAIVAVQAHQRQSEWFFWCILSFILAVFLPLAYFGIHPLFVRLGEWRGSYMATHLERRAAARAAAAAARTTGPSVAASISRPAPSREIPSGGARLEVQYAAYGADGPFGHTGWLDVTNQVRNAINNGSITIPVNNSQFGEDPVENVPKVLRVDFTVAGRSYTEMFDEGSVATLP